MKRIFVRIVAATIIILSMLVMIPNVKANDQGCRDIIQVIPIGSIETGEPRITTSPANLMISHTGQNVNIVDVHLLIIIDKPTYDSLDNIIINNSTHFIVLSKGSFSKGDGGKIGLDNCKYPVNAIKDKLKIKGGDIYYSFTYFMKEITKDPTYFTIEVHSSPINVLVLALGKLEGSETFNACSSFSKSTLVIPEVATLALTTASFLGAGSFYLIKRRKLH
ncbi:MAG: hypothetical protein QXO15_03555 [Nitrososphaerota archaeon]